MMNKTDKVYIIAEAGVNHNGSLAVAKDMIAVAAGAGANAIKFQTFKAERLVTKTTEKAVYQKQTTARDESQYEMLKRLELAECDYMELLKCCADHNIDFLSTPFDDLSLKFLVEECGVDTIKIPSGEITNAPFLLEIAYTGKSVILSTGMSSLGEIETALGVLAFGYLRLVEAPLLESFAAIYQSPEGQQILREKVVLLHCTSEYPAAMDTVNLRCMDTLRQAFGLAVGYSDHTRGVAVSLAAAARGAVVVEKHFTLDRSMEGPDHQASIEPDELRALVDGIRNIEVALGSGIKRISNAEQKNRAVVRKCLIAKKRIEKGEVFTADNITVKRVAEGVSPLLYWSYMDKRATREYQADEKIDGI